MGQAFLADGFVVRNWYMCTYEEILYTYEKSTKAPFSFRVGKSGPARISSKKLL